MDFLNNHAEITKKEFENITKIVIEKFQYFYADEILSENVIREIDNIIHNDYLGSEQFKKYKVNFQILYERFLAYMSIYPYKDAKVKKVLEKQLHDEFIENLRLNDHYNAETISYEDFIPLFLKFIVYQKTSSRLNYNEKLYIILYENNYYDEFILEKIEGNVEESEKFKKFHKKFYPNKPLPYDLNEKNESGETENIVYPETNGEELDKKENRKQTYNHDFDIDEQALILNLCLEGKKEEIPTTEKIKLLILIGKVKDESIFNEDSNINVFYSKVNKGINRKGSTKTMINTIDIILTKIESYDVNNTKVKLRYLRTKLISDCK